MASNITFNGVTYSIPAVGDDGWGSDLSAYFIAIASGALQKTGGNFTLTAEANFGATFGLKSAYLKSQATNPASAGIVRLGNNESISWRNFANNADINLKVNTSDSLEFNGASILYGLILNANVDPAAAIALSKLATVTASRVLVSDVSGIITASAITTTTLAFLDATSSIQTQLDAKANSASPTFTGTVTLPSSIVSGAATLTFPTATGTFSTLAGTEVITNKDIDGGTAANTRRITLPKNTLTNLTSLTRKQGTLVFDTTSNKPYYDDGSNLRVIGSGSGGAGNLIDDGDGEAGITNYAEGSYSAATRPAGTFTASSGTGTFAIGTTTTTPIAGTTSLTLTKSSGASRQGRAVERTISLDLENRAKVLEMRIKYIVVSGTFVAGSSSADSSLIWYIGQFNGSTWTYTEPSSFKMLSNSTTISDVLIGNFQTNADTTQVKLIAYVAESTNSAWEIKCEVAIQPCNYVYGTPITDWVSYTPNISNLGTGSSTSNVAKWRRVGDSAEYMITFQKDASGGSGASVVTWSLVSGQSVDANKLPFGSATAKADNIGSAWVVSGGNYSASNYVPLVNSATTFAISKPTTSGQLTGADIPASTYIIFKATVPITGWSSSTQQSDGYDGRLVSARVNRTALQSVADTASPAVAFDTVEANGVNAFSTGISGFTVPSSGEYNVSASVQFAVNGTNSREVKLVVNSVVVKSLGFVNAPSGSASCIVGGSATITVRAGDVVSIQASQNSGGSLNIGGNALYTWFCIDKIQTSTTISATEKVVASYTDNSAQAITVSNQVIGFNTLKEDTHGIKTGTGTGTQFTIPVSGSYRIDVYLSCDSTTTAGNQYWIPKILVSAAVVAEGGGRFANSHQFPTGHVFYEDVFAAGTVITIAVDTNVGASRSLTNSVLGNRVLITRIK